MPKALLLLPWPDHYLSATLKLGEAKVRRYAGVVMAAYRRFGGKSWGKPWVAEVTLANGRVASRRFLPGRVDYSRASGLGDGVFIQWVLSDGTYEADSADGRVVFAVASGKIEEVSHAL